MELIDALKTRRSIRTYQQKPVDDDTLAFILEAARIAPSWANSQCWRFVVVRDAAKKEALSVTMGKNPAAEAVKTCPVVIVACAVKGRAGYFKDPQPVTDKGEYWYMYDVALAMDHLTLAAHSKGLGTVHIGLFDAAKAAQVVGVPDGYCVVSMTPLGYPEGEAKVTPRKELAEIVSYDTFEIKE